MSDTNDAGPILPSATTSQDTEENKLAVTDQMVSRVARFLIPDKFDSFGRECLELTDLQLANAKGVSQSQQNKINYEGLKRWYESKKEHRSVGALKEVLDHGIKKLGLNPSVCDPLRGLENSDDLKTKYLSKVSRRFSHNDWTKFSNEHNIDLSDNAAFLELPNPDPICIALDILHTWRNMNYKDANVKSFKDILQDGIDYGFIDVRVQEELKDIIKVDLRSISEKEQEKTCRGIIRKHYEELLDDLTDPDTITSILYEEKVLSSRQNEWIRELGHRQEKVGFILRKLSEKNDKEQLNTFIKALEKTLNKTLAKKLKADMTS